jgi:hypothetical protein
VNTAQTVLAVIGGVVALLVMAGGAWAILASSAKDAMGKRLQGDNDYLRKQLDFIEPRFRDAEAKNEMLMKLHNPTAKLDQMTILEQANHEETLRLLREQRDILVSIEEKFDEEKS